MYHINEDRELRRQRLLHHMEMRRKIIGFSLGLCVLLAVFLAFFVLQREDVQKKYIYPYSYREYIDSCSREYDVDPYLVAAVIKTESKFKYNATSNYGAIGLMQLMPETAIWISGQLDDTGFYLDQLKEPQCNIRYGTWYLASLQEEFQGNEVLMLAAYNAGRGNVLSWMKQYGWDYSFNNPEEIPYRETQEYVKSVLGNRNKYQKLYEVQE